MFEYPSLSVIFAVLCLLWVLFEWAGTRMYTTSGKVKKTRIGKICERKNYRGRWKSKKKDKSTVRSWSKISRSSGRSSQHPVLVPLDVYVDFYWHLRAVHWNSFDFTCQNCYVKTLVLKYKTGFFDSLKENRSIVLPWKNLYFLGPASRMNTNRKRIFWVRAGQTFTLARRKSISDYWRRENVLQTLRILQKTQETLSSTCVTNNSFLRFSCGLSSALPCFGFTFTASHSYKYI